MLPKEKDKHQSTIMTSLQNTLMQQYAKACRMNRPTSDEICSPLHKMGPIPDLALVAKN